MLDWGRLAGQKETLSLQNPAVDRTCGLSLKVESGYDAAGEAGELGAGVAGAVGGESGRVPRPRPARIK